MPTIPTSLRLELSIDEALSAPIIPVRLRPEELARARTLIDLLTVVDGTRLAVRGSRPDRALVIASGRVEATRPGHRPLTLSAGQTVGAWALRTGRPQPWTVHTVTDCQLLSIERGVLLRLDQLIPRLALGLDLLLTAAEA